MLALPLLFCVAALLPALPISQAGSCVEFDSNFAVLSVTELAEPCACFHKCYSRESLQAVASGSHAIKATCSYRLFCDASWRGDSEACREALSPVAAEVNDVWDCQDPTHEQTKARRFTQAKNVDSVDMPIYPPPVYPSPSYPPPYSPPPTPSRSSTPMPPSPSPPAVVNATARTVDISVKITMNYADITKNQSVFNAFNATVQKVIEKQLERPFVVTRIAPGSVIVDGKAYLPPGTVNVTDSIVTDITSRLQTLDLSTTPLVAFGASGKLTVSKVSATPPPAPPSSNKKKDDEQRDIDLGVGLGVGLGGGLILVGVVGAAVVMNKKKQDSQMIAKPPPMA